MVHSQTRDASEATIISLSEGEMAIWMREQGKKVIEHRGRYWIPISPGFYDPVHPMAKLTAEETTRPTKLCWGYRAPLCDADSRSANATMPVYELQNLRDFDLQTLKPKRRTNIRKCLRQAEIVEIIQPDLLYEQGYSVYFSACKRIGMANIPDINQYRKEIGHYFDPNRVIILGGLINKKLAGYVVAYAVEGTAYVLYNWFATEYLSTNIGSALTFELFQAFRRSEKISRVISGLHTPDHEPLHRFKIEMGLSVVHVPAFVWFAPLAASYVRLRRPYSYYRLTGID